MAIVWLSLFHYYTAFSGFLAYFFIAGKKIRISNMDFLFLCGLALLLMLQIPIKGMPAIVIDLRFYWGWLIFYFIFKVNAVNRKMLNDALVLLSVLTLMEAVLINTVIPAHMLPNFPDFETGIREWVGEGIYQRPYSFGASATVSSSLLVVLMAICNVRDWRFWLSTSAVLAFISGTGTLELLLLLLIRYRALLVKSLLPLLAVSLLSSFFFSEAILSLLDKFMNKVGPDYIGVLVDLKWSSIVDSYQTLGVYEYIFGDPNGFRGGDFGFFAFVLSNGFFGFLLFLSILISRINKDNALPLFIIVTASFHYPVLFFLPGQMILGLLLSIRQSGLLDSAAQGRVIGSMALKSH